MGIQGADAADQGSRGIVYPLLWFCRKRRMAGPRSSPWVKLLLAAVLSISLPGNMGESKHPRRHPSRQLLRHNPAEVSYLAADICTSLRLENLRVHALPL